MIQTNDANNDKSIESDTKNKLAENEVGNSSLLNTKVQVFEDGFVRVVDLMGTDSSVVQAARVSYGAGTKTPSDDAKLLRYMMRHRHTSPFEMCEIKLHIRAPIFVARQWLRHRTANVNEYSARYSIMVDKFYYPSFESFMKQSSKNKQGRDELFSQEDYDNLTADIKQSCEGAYAIYQNLLDKGVSREIARIILPVNIYTEFYWKIDAHNMMHFLKLRCSANAQEEIRAYANAIAGIFAQWMPITHQAFVDYQMESSTYSKEEIEMLKNSLNRESFLENCAKTKSLSQREIQSLKSWFID